MSQTKPDIVSKERVSVLTGMVDREHFDKYRQWLYQHVGDYNNGWRVKFISETGIRTMVIFDNPKHKFMFDIAWTDSVIQLSHDVLERAGWQ